MIGLETDYPETIAIGMNEHIRIDPANLLLALARVMTGQRKTWAIPPMWEVKSAVAA